ncbi:hypothetical protein ALC62_00780 [Cyphomyrmex costatus]|uniref:Glycoprotein n=1 Tax=Cyphomyrmex costatus TaxID=456900 RepID=A0A151IQ07_9HYME|nr:hypothetical protein ALC62_00780 [Cyphomyrmex costatus]
MHPVMIIFVFAPLAHGLIGYDCGATSGDGFNISTLSLLDVGNCDLEDVEPREEEVYIQLMQMSDYDKVPALQCKIEVTRVIHYCGMHSHVSIVHNGQREYFQEIGEQSCRRLHETGVLKIGNAVMDLIKPNATNYRSATLAGTATVDGKCSGAQYTDGYGSWDNVIVQAVVKITLRTLELPVKRKLGHVVMPSGTFYTIANRYCIDADGSETYWSPVAIDNCHFDQYDILYEGLATRLVPQVNYSTPIVYTVTTQETTFALTKTTDMDVCGYKLSQTEHPKLFILQTQKGRTFKTRGKITVDNLDIFLYVNSKFVYVEKHIKKQLTQLYRNLMEQKCALERQVLQNALTLASIAPDETAYRIMREPGYTAVLSGEALHLVKCIPVECKLRQAEHCYTELPVTHANASFFLQPRTRILTKTGTIRDCNHLLPIMYKLYGIWFRLTPKPVEVIAPTIIQPMSHPTWHYTSSSSLATSGIYSTEDLDRLRAHIMFPVERPSIVNTLARGAMGNDIPAGSISLSNLLDEDSLNRIVDSAGKRVWRGFVTFGSASAGVLAIFIIIRTTKLVIDTIIHGYALHTMYGWSLHLVGAIWSSVTHLLLHLGSRRNPRPQDNIRTETPEEASCPPAPPPTPEDRPSTSRSSSEGLHPSHSQPNVIVSTINEKQAAPALYKTYTYTDLRKHLDTNTSSNN